MEESQLYTARVQVVEAMERGIPFPAAHETDLLSQLEGALPVKHQHPPVQKPAPPQLFQPQLKLLLTLLFLNAVGLHRPWDLRDDTGTELGLLTARLQPSSYRHVERFLSRLAIANADEAFTAAVARWTSALWQVKVRSQEATSPQVYVDGLSLAVYTDTLSSPRTDRELRQNPGLPCIDPVA